MSRAGRWNFSEQGNEHRHNGIHSKFHPTLDVDIRNSTSNREALKPPGHIAGRFDNDGANRTSEQDRAKLIMNQAWAKAKAPAKQIMMSALMSWMSGNNISIISLMMIFMVMINPLKALFSVNNEFKKYENELNRKKSNNDDENVTNEGMNETSVEKASQQHSLLLPKLLFVAINLVCVGIGVYKFNTLGLLPTPSHLPPILPVPSYLEFSAGTVTH